MSEFPFEFIGIGAELKDTTVIRAGQHSSYQSGYERL